MEKNIINNIELKIKIANSAINVLSQKKIITEKDYLNLNVNFGYILLKENGDIESLLKVNWNENVQYFAIQNNKLMNIDINEKSYQETIDTMKLNHPCLNQEPSFESEQCKDRKARNIEILKSKGITYSENLGCLSENRKVKNIDVLCKRAIACLLVIQTACDINNGNDYQESVKIVNSLLEKFDVKSCLNSKERRIMEGTYSQQDCYDMDWAYEIYWAVCWALGLVDNIENAEECCDCNKAISLVINSKSYDDFKKMCKLRSKEEILDMEDLYYRYEWAINQSQIDDSTKTGNLNFDNVIERKRGLSWVLSDADDWYNLGLSEIGITKESYKIDDYAIDVSVPVKINDNSNEKKQQETNKSKNDNKVNKEKIKDLFKGALFGLIFGFSGFIFLISFIKEKNLAYIILSIMMFLVMILVLAPFYEGLIVKRKSRLNLGFKSGKMYNGINIMIDSDSKESKEHFTEDYKVLEKEGIESLIRNQFVPWIKGKQFKDRDDNKTYEGLRLYAIAYHYGRSSMINKNLSTNEENYYGQFSFSFESSNDYTKDMLESVTIQVYILDGKIVKISGFND